MKIFNSMINKGIFKNYKAGSIINKAIFQE